MMDCPQFTETQSTIEITAPALIRLEGDVTTSQAVIEYQNSQGIWELVTILTASNIEVEVNKSGTYRITKKVSECDTTVEVVVIPVTEYTGLSVTPVYDVYPGKGATCETTELPSTFAVGADFALVDQLPLDAANVALNGLTEDATYIYVIDTGTNTIFRYTKSPFALVDQLTLDAANVAPTGMTEDATYIYVVDNGTDTIFRYTKSPFVLVDQLTLDAANGLPNGITEDATYIYVADIVTGTIFRYTKSPFVLVDQLTLDAANGLPTGMTADATYIYVAGTAPAVIRYTKPVTGLISYTKVADSGNGDFTLSYEFSDQAEALRFRDTMAAIAGPQNRTQFSVVGPFIHPRQIDAYLGGAGNTVAVLWDHTNIEEDLPDPLTLPCVDPVSDNNYDTANDALRDFYEAMPLGVPQIPTVDFTYTVTQYVATGLECDEIKQVELGKSDGSVEPGGYLNPDGSVHELKGTPSFSCPNKVIGSEYESPFFLTETLSLINDTFALDPINFTSLTFYVKEGSIAVSRDGGATFPAQYDATDAPVWFGDGTENLLATSQIVFKALEANTILQIAGDSI